MNYRTIDARNYYNYFTKPLLSIIHSSEICLDLVHPQLVLHILWPQNLSSLCYIWLLTFIENIKVYCTWVFDNFMLHLVFLLNKFESIILFFSDTSRFCSTMLKDIWVYNSLIYLTSKTVCWDRQVDLSHSTLNIVFKC